MPFIKQERREIIGEEGLDGLRKLYSKGDYAQPGDRCYVFYKDMVKRWKYNPRWTTAHDIFRDLCENPIDNYDDGAARELAWQVFFQLYVMPYELKKREENGDI